MGLCKSPYRQTQKPTYRKDLDELNQQGIYVTPGTLIGQPRFVIQSFNCLSDSYWFAFRPNAIAVEQSRVYPINYPQFGRARMLAIGNEFSFYVISEEKIVLPSYIRLGKFNSKARIEWSICENELINQHSEDVKEFVQEAGLEYNVISVDAKILKKLEANSSRNGEKLHQLIMNPLQFADQLDLQIKDQKVPFVLVTNPDIFYYALYLLYNQFDQRNLFADFMKPYQYIIIDEFHYYNTKQFANFLLFMTMSKIFGYFERGRKICLLTATPSEYVQEYLQRLGVNLEVIDLKADSDDLMVLSKARVRIVSGDLESNFSVVKQYWNEWRDCGLDGVFISDSLARINLLYNRLKGLEVWAE